MIAQKSRLPTFPPDTLFGITMIRLFFFCSLTYVFLLPLTGAERPKNIVLIMADDIGVDSYGVPIQK
jgi:hypothetical protein